MPELMGHGPAELPPSVEGPAELRTGAGSTALAPVVITNRSAQPRIMSVTVLGVDSAWLPRPSRSQAVRPGESVYVDVPFSPAVGTMPARYPLAIAVQALDPVSEQATSPTTLIELALIVDAPGQISLALATPDVTAVFRRRIQIVLQNTGALPATVELEVRAPKSTRVHLDARQVEVGPGRTVPIGGRVSPRKVRLFGSRSRHAYTITGRSSGAPRHVEGSFTSRAMLGPGGSKATAIIAVVGVWLALAIIFIPKLADSSRNRQNTVAGATATAPATGANSGSGTGQPGGSGSPGANGSASAAADAAAKIVQLNGVVSGDSPGAVTVSISQTSLVDERAVGASPVGLSSNAYGEPGMIAGEALSLKAPAGDRATTTADDGAWSFAGVKRPGYYLVSFAKVGYQTQRFIVDSAAAVATQPLNVTLVPGDGQLSGRVLGPGGAIGGAQVTITDGTNTITTSSNSKGDVGSWTVSGLSTPGDYLVSAGKAGLGTESALVHLNAGGSAETTLTLRAGVSSIVGTVTSAAGGGLGGIAVTATDGTTTRTASTVTVASLRGRYTLSDLPAPGTYTVSFAGAGYLEQTVSVTIAKGQTSAKVDVALFPAAASVTGTLTGDLLDRSGKAIGSGPLVGAGLVLTSPDQTYKTTSAADGEYRFDGVAPGTYVLTAQYAGLSTAYESVIVPPGTAQTVTVPTIHLSQLAEVINRATIVGFVGDGSNPSNTLCPQHPGDCLVTFTLKASDGTPKTITTTDPTKPADDSQPTASSGPTGYTLSSTDNLEPGLYRLSIGAKSKPGTPDGENPTYLPVTVAVQVPLNSVARAPQVNLYPANTISGTVQVGGDLINDGPAPPYTNCVYAMLPGQPAPDLSKCDPTQLPPSTCLVTGAAGAAYAAFQSDDTYNLSPLCDGSYTLYYVITNPWFVNNVQPAVVTVSHGETRTLPIVVSTHGKLTVTLSQVSPATNEQTALAADVPVVVTCTSGSGQTITEPTVTTDGTLRQSFIFGGFAAGVWECTAAAPGFTNRVTTGQFTIANGDVLQRQLTFTAPAGTFVGQINTSWSGAPTGVPGGSVTITGTTGYVNGVAQTSTVSVTPDTRGCFAFSPSATLPDGFSAPGACAGDPELGSATVALPLVYANATVSVTPASGYQAPANLTNQPLTVGQLISINIAPNPVTLDSGNVQTNPATTPGAGAFAGFTIAVTATPPGAGRVTLSIDPNTGDISWQDVTLPAGQIAPGAYPITVSKSGFVTASTSVTCLPGSACQLGTITLQKLGGLTVTVTSDGTTPVAGATVTLETGTGQPLLTAQTSGADGTLGGGGFDGLTPGGSYAVRVQAAGFQFGDTLGASPLVTLECDDAATTIVIAAGGQTHCTATLTRSGAIAGVVTEILALPSTPSPATQNPADLPVSVQSCGTDSTCARPSGPVFTTNTGNDGTFRISGTSANQGLDVGYWLLTIEATGYSPPAGARGFIVRVTASDTDTTYNPQLYIDPVTFTVTVKDQTTKVVGGLGNSAVTLMSGGTVIGTATETGTGTSTTYVFTNAIPGAYTLDVTADSYLSANQQVTLAVGRPTQTFTITVTAGANRVGGAITGVQNTDTADTPLAGATVCVIKAGAGPNETCGSGAASSDVAAGTDGLPLWQKLTTDTFTFNTVPDGPFHLRVERYGYQPGTGGVVTYKHNQAAPAPVSFSLTRVTRVVTVTVTTSDPTDDISAAAQASAQLTSAAASGSIPGNATLTADAARIGTDNHVRIFTFNTVPYGCWTFTFQAPANHYGTLGAPNPAGGDANLACTAAQFIVPGVPASGTLGVGYLFSEFQPKLIITTNPVPGEVAPTGVNLSVDDGRGATFLNGPFTISATATPLGFWVAPDVTVHLSAAPGFATWPVVITTITAAAPTGTIALQQPRASVQITVVKAGVPAPVPVSGAAVTLTVPAGSGFAPRSGTTDSGGIATFTVPYGSGWIATATSGALAGTSGAFTTNATQANVPITVAAGP